MPAIVVCAACQTKLKVPENSTAKALKCPKCKGVVPIAPPKKEPPAEPPKPKAPPPKDEDEFEVNEPVAEKDEEFEVNAAADEDEEHEVNEAADDEGNEDKSESEEKEPDDDSALAELGFTKVKDVYKKGEVPDKARKAIEKSFVKNEKAVWAGRPSVKLIESKAWIGLIAGPAAVLIGIAICLLTSGLGIFVISETAGKIIAIAMGGLFALVFSAVGVLAFIFRKRIGGNIEACYVVTNKRAYIFDGSLAVQAFMPHQLAAMASQESSSFAGAGDLIFGYSFMGQEGVLADKEDVDKHGEGVHGGQQSKAVGFLNIDNLDLVKRMINEVLVEKLVDKAEAKAKRKKEKAKKRYKPFGG